MTSAGRKIIMLGGGGHAKVLIDLIRLSREYEIAGILDRQLPVGKMVYGVPVLGDDGLLPAMPGKGILYACIGVGSVKDTSLRQSLYKNAKEAGLSMPPLIHPSSTVSGSSALSEGVQIMARAVIQADSIIGENTIINTGAIIEHDCVIGRHAHVCPGAVVSGVCKIGDSTFIGAGATVINGISIGRNVTVGAGSVVVENISDGAVVMGVPAR